MATHEATTHPFEIAIHICTLCRKDLASGLDGKGFPTNCKACRSNRRRTGTSSASQKRRKTGTTLRKIRKGGQQ